MGSLPAFRAVNLTWPEKIRDGVAAETLDREVAWGSDRSRRAFPSEIFLGLVPSKFDNRLGYSGISTGVVNPGVVG